MQKTNKKTIIFQSPEIKALCDGLIQARSKETGISIMRLIENALLKEFGFCNDKFTQWCTEYDDQNASLYYVSLLRILPNNDDIFMFYKMICDKAGIPVDNDHIIKHPIVIENGGPVTNSDISANKVVERVFHSCNKKDLSKIFYDFTYNVSSILDKNPLLLEDIVMFLYSIDRRDNKNE